eukprot:860685-Pyramimonas_sp.AAC.1
MEASVASASANSIDGLAEFPDARAAPKDLQDRCSMQDWASKRALSCGSVPEALLFRIIDVISMLSPRS